MISSSSTTSTRPSPCATRARLPGLPRPCRRIGRRSGAGAGERASCPSGLVILLCLAGPPVPAASPAPIAQGIEQRPPEPCAQVRILLGAPRKYLRKLALTRAIMSRQLPWFRHSPQARAAVRRVPPPYGPHAAGALAATGHGTTPLAALLCLQVMRFILGFPLSGSRPGCAGPPARWAGGATRPCGRSIRPRG